MKFYSKLKELAMRIIKVLIHADEQKKKHSQKSELVLTFNLSVLVLPQDRVFYFVDTLYCLVQKRMSEKHFRKNRQFVGSRTTLLVEDRTFFEFHLS